MGGFGRRLANAGLALWWYAGHALAPFRLMAVYPPWNFGAVRALDFLPLFALILLVASLWWWRGRMRGLFFGVSAFVIILLPILGFVTMSFARSGTLVADHLQYFANIALVALVAAGLVRLRDGRARQTRFLGTTAIVLLLAGYLFQTAARAAVYRTEETFWRDNLQKNPQTWQGHNRLGEILFARGEFNAALPHLQQAAELYPSHPLNHNQLGLVLARLESFDEAVAAFRRALEIGARDQSLNPKTEATVRVNLANALGAKAGRLQERGDSQAPAIYEEAISSYRAALRHDPANAAAHRNLAIVLVQLGRGREAIPHLEQALELAPADTLARELLSELRRAF